MKLYTRGVLIVPSSDDIGLQGVTLKVYLYVMKKNGTVGPRDIMRSLHLSSPSVAYRHLQKLEALGLLAKDDYGNYVATEKVPVLGYVWLGRNLIPNPIFYSLIFLSILIIELVVLAMHYSVESQEFKIFFLLMGAITTGALILFIFEGRRMLIKIRSRHR